MFPLPPLTDEQRERGRARGRARARPLRGARGAVRRRLHVPLRELRRPARGRPARPRGPARVRGRGRRPGDLRARPPRDRQGLLGHRAHLQHALHGDHLPGRARAPRSRSGATSARWWAAGARIASITSEPEQSFRDKFVLNTVFRSTGDGGYRVAGVKQFCSLGDAADYFFITGILEGHASARDGVVSAMIPSRDAGVKIEGTWNATGMRGTDQPHHPLRLRGRGRQRGGRPGAVPHHRPAGLRPRLRRGLPGHRRGRLRVHDRDGAHQDPATLDRADEPPSAGAAHGGRGGHPDPRRAAAPARGGRA